MFKFAPLLALVCAVSCAPPSQTCTEDVFKNLNVLKDRTEVTAKSSADVQDAYTLEITNAIVPTLCKYSVQDMPALYQLVFHSNQMREIQPGAFKNVPSLMSVRISTNELRVIPNGVFNHLKIKRLDFRKNKIETVEKGAFDNMPELSVLEIDFNELKELDPSWFNGSPNVKRLSAGDNLLQSVPEGAFANMGGNVVDIWLMNNKISHVHPAAFKGITRANYLWLQDNRIEELDDGLFAGVAEIERLSLSGNKLKCVSDAFLRNLHAKSVSFDSNPLECEECLPKLKKWAKDAGVDSKVMVRRLECVVERARKTLDESKA